MDNKLSVTATCHYKTDARLNNNFTFLAYPNEMGSTVLLGC